MQSRWIRTLLLSFVLFAYVDVAQAALTRVNLGIYGGQALDVVAYSDTSANTRLLAAVDGDIGAVRLNDAGTLWRGAFLGRPGAVNELAADLTDAGIGSGAHTLFAVFATGELRANSSEQSGSFDRTAWTTVTNGGLFYNAGSVLEGVVTVVASASGTYVGTWAGNVYRTTDGGATWSLLANLGVGSRVRSIAVYLDDPTNPRLWVIAETSPNVGVLYPITYSGGYAVGAAMSVSGGLTAIQRVFVYPSTTIGEAPLLFVTGDSPSQSLYRGPNDGAAWTTVSEMFHYYQDMAFDAVNDRIYAVGAVSTDRGATFTTLPSYSRVEGNIHPNDGAIALDPNNSSQVYMGDDWFVGKWTEAAGSWSASGPLASNDGVTAVLINDMSQVADSAATKDVFAIGGKAGVGVTQDFVSHAGAHPTWTFPIYPMDDGGVVTTVRLRDADSDGSVETLFVGNRGSKLYRSTTLGLTAAAYTMVFDGNTAAAAWLTNPQRSDLSDLAFSPSASNEMWLSVADWDGSNVGGAVFCSTDSGATWAIDPGWAAQADPMAVNALQVTATKFWAGVGSNGDTNPVHRGLYSMIGGLAACTSTDWQPFTTGTGLDSEIVNDLDGPTTSPVYVATSGGLYRGVFSGAWTFSELTGGAGALATLPNGTNDSYTAVAYNPSPSGYDEEFYAATGDQIYRLRLSGAVWSVTLISPTPHEAVNVLLWDALVVGSENGVTSLGLPSDAQRKCRTSFRKARKNLLKAALKAQSGCRDRALENFVNCPDSSAQSLIDMAVAKIDLTKGCEDATVAALAAEWPDICEGATTVAELETCLSTSVQSAALEAVDGEYGAQSLSRVGVSTKCQKSIGKTMGGKYLLKALANSDKCAAGLDKGKRSTCPDDSMTNKSAALAESAAGSIAASCSTSDLVALNSLGFGGSCSGATNATDLATCQLSDHDSILESMTTTP